MNFINLVLGAKFVKGCVRDSSWVHVLKKGCSHIQANVFTAFITWRSTDSGQVLGGNIALKKSVIKQIPASEIRCFMQFRVSQYFVLMQSVGKAVCR